MFFNRSGNNRCRLRLGRTPVFITITSLGERVRAASNWFKLMETTGRQICYTEKKKEKREKTEKEKKEEKEEEGEGRGGEEEVEE